MGADYRCGHPDCVHDDCLRVASGAEAAIRADERASIRRAVRRVAKMLWGDGILFCAQDALDILDRRDKRARLEAES